MQSYFKASIFSNDETEVLIRLRSKTLEVKANFPKQYLNNTACRMQNCYSDENQEHLYSGCSTLNNSLKQLKPVVPYNAIYKRSVKRQSEVTKRFINLLAARSDILKTS